MDSKNLHSVQWTVDSKFDLENTFKNLKLSIGHKTHKTTIRTQLTLKRTIIVHFKFV